MLKIEKTSKKLVGVKYIDLFCGIGGFHLALSSFGAKCVFASEIDEKASKVYKKNHKIQPEGDICKIKSSQIPKHDILCAGFPCQAFSISGKQNGFNDKNGKLFFEIIRIARYHKPKLILLENVKNLISHDEGKTINTIENSLRRIGYKSYKQVICASDFGVAQARKRLYIVAFRNDIDVKNFRFPEVLNSRKQLKDILQEDVSEEYYINRQYRLSMPDILKTNDIIRVGSVGKGRQGERIYSIEGQAITLSSQGGGIGGKTGLYFIENRVRKLTPRECARLMGFPERFQLSETDAESYKQLGNSVVVNVLQAIIKEVIKYLG